MDIDRLGHLGIRLWQTGDLDGSLACFQDILRLDPTAWQASRNVGLIYAQQDKHDLAMLAYQQCVAVCPEAPNTYVAIGLAANRLGRLQDAMGYFQKAVDVDPGASDAHTNLGMSLVLHGDFERGWQELEWRHEYFHRSTGKSKEEVFGMPPARRWQGEPVDHLLVHYEQGMGDTIQSLRYVPLIQAKHISLIVQPSLHELVRYNLRGQPHIEVCEQMPAKVSAYVWIDSLPWLFRAGTEPIPNAPYLSVPSIHDWEQRLAHLERPRVGLVWAGRPGMGTARHKSIPPELLTGLLDQAASFVSLQKDSDWTHERVFNAAPFLTDWMETATAMCALDLVITVDTSAVHMAGALGRDVWMLNCYDLCWTWLLETETSQWYPTARIFRQLSPGDWPSAIRQLPRLA